VLELCRFHQYIKNIFIFLPLLFTPNLININTFTITLIAFGSFSLLSSAVYIFNDIYDLEYDLKHPGKKNRPLPSGKIKISSAVILMLLCLFLSCIGFSFLNHNVIKFVACYLGLNIAYTLKLKHVAVLDVVIIATGFVLRLFIGSTVTGINLTLWIIVITFLLAMFLGFAKRVDDILIFNQTSQKPRKVIDGYNIEFLRSSMLMIASAVIVFYALYTISSDVTAKLGHGNNLYLTTVFVLLGILRYLQLTFVYNVSGCPTKILLKDRHIQIVIAGWLLAFSWIIHL